ncbi:MAG: hypothetical protein RSE23_01855 [Clostridia bacterium]
MAETRTKLGPIRFKPKGVYSATAAYTKYDCVVGADGCLYCAKISTTGNAPPSAAHWILILDNAALVTAAATATKAATSANEAAAAANIAATAALASAADPTTGATIAYDEDGFGHIIFKALPPIV